MILSFRKNSGVIPGTKIYVRGAQPGTRNCVGHVYKVFSYSFDKIETVIEYYGTSGYYHHSFYRYNAIVDSHGIRIFSEASLYDSKL